MFDPLNQKAAETLLALNQEKKARVLDGSLPEWYSTQGYQMYLSKYAYKGQTVRERFRSIAKTLSKHMYEDAAYWEQRFFDLMWEGILSPSTPALANLGTDRGMPVACSGQVIGDSVESFYGKLQETALLSKWGFGTSGDFSQIRPRGSPISRGGVATGATVVMHDFFTCASKISQGGTRRGSFAAHLDIMHGDFNETIQKFNLDPNGKNYVWTITDEYVEALKGKDKEALARFNEMLTTKRHLGKGCLFFKDKANRQRPIMYKDKGLTIEATNLCTEIMLHSSLEYTFSCIIASLNLVHWDKIKLTDAIFVSLVFLDCLCSEFINISEGIAGLESVREFTKKGRAVALSAMGFHTYLQAKNIPYESLEAQFINSEISALIDKESLRASRYLASLFGEPEWCKGYGVRNTHRIAYAPTKSTSVLMGNVSESWFPEPALIYDAPSASGELRRMSPILYKLMQERGVYNSQNISDIIKHLGSVQHVDWLTKHEKRVFKNAFEIDQRILYRYTKQRQKYVCQGQSLNFYIPEDGSEDLLSELITLCVLDEDILSQYYDYSRSGVVIQDECLNCHG